MPRGQKFLLWSLFCTVWFLLLPAEGQETTHPEVETQLGRVRGKQVAVKGTERQVDVFLGIPFAKPPLGDGRFSPPQPAEPWEGVKDATEFPPMCLQELERTELMKNTLDGKIQLSPMSEDCLYLNIYTPASRQKEDKLPVMFWIHGGSMTIGAASLHDGSPLSAYEDIVVVVVQYRLGFQGFLSSGDEIVPGNWGLLDLVAALQWVQGNIAHFGGDPSSVTISGQSIGGVFASVLVLSPMTKGLIHRAISQSGVSSVTGLFTYHPNSVFQDVAHYYDCKGSSSAVIIQCLRKKENMIFTRKFSSVLPFISASVDGIFLPKLPEELLLEKEFPKIPYLVGVNNHEFGWLVPTAWTSYNLEDGMKREIAISMLDSKKTFLGIPSEMIHVFADEYIGNETDPFAIRDALLDLAGDSVIFQTLKVAKNHRDSGAPVYLYEFQHRPSTFDKIRPAFVKADHSAELTFVFGGPFMTDERSMLAFPDPTEEEKQLSRMMMRYWANFVWTGDPNGEGLPNWPLFDQSEVYLELNLTQKINRKLKEDKMEFWRKSIHEKAKCSEEKKGHMEL